MVIENINFSQGSTVATCHRRCLASLWALSVKGQGKQRES